MPNFDFGMYLEMNLNFLVVDFVEVEEATWWITGEMMRVVMVR
jgi:hypothetical protein